MSKRNLLLAGSGMASLLLGMAAVPAMAQLNAAKAVPEARTNLNDLKPSMKASPEIAFSLRIGVNVETRNRRPRHNFCVIVHNRRE